MAGHESIKEAGVGASALQVLGKGVKSKADWQTGEQGRVKGAEFSTGFKPGETGTSVKGNKLESQG